MPFLGLSGGHPALKLHQAGSCDFLLGDIMRVLHSHMWNVAAAAWVWEMTETAVVEPATKRQTACGHSNPRFLRSISSAPTSSKAHTNLKTSRDAKETCSHGPPVGAHAHTPTAPRDLFYSQCYNFILTLFLLRSKHIKGPQHLPPVSPIHLCSLGIWPRILTMEVGGGHWELGKEQSIHHIIGHRHNYLWF